LKVAVVAYSLERCLNDLNGDHQERIDPRGITHHGLFPEQQCPLTFDQRVVKEATANTTISPVCVVRMT
jgi:hypothetical protein